MGRTTLRRTGLWWLQRAGIPLFVALVIVAGLLLWQRTGTPAAERILPIERGAARGFNVLLVTWDTVRSDRLGCYGYAAAQTPVCDALARGGVRFADAVTSVPITLPSHTTILTGLYPPHTGVRDNGRHHLSDVHVTLAETLKQQGYDTAAFVGCFVLDARFGLDQGFDVYDFQVTPEGLQRQRLDFNERPANAVSDAAIDWLEQRAAAGRQAPFFMFLHYFDPHQPYTSPLQALPQFANRGYDAEIAFADQHFGRVLQELDALGLRERTIVVLTSDHGEGFGEHGELSHGMLLYRGTMHVPLIISCPALFSGPLEVTDQLVGLVDIRPTVEDLLGLRVTPGDGRSLLRPPDPDRSIYMETLMPSYQAGWSPLYALRRGNTKYILAPRCEYYDLSADPHEQHNLVPSQPADLAALAEDLNTQLQEYDAVGPAERDVSDDELQRLASLGYAQIADALPDGPRLNPVDMMPLYNRSFEAEVLYGRQQYAQAADVAREVVDQCAHCIVARRVLAFSLLRLGRAQEAVDVLRESVSHAAQPFLVRSLAEALIIEDRFEQAEDVLALYESIDPQDGRVPLLRGDILMRQDRLDAAASCYEQARRLDPARVGLVATERLERIVRQRAP